MQRTGRSEAKWIATSEERAYVASLMVCVVESGNFANGIAPRAMGINRWPIDFEYVRQLESSPVPCPGYRGL
jgi:benzoyl-CoA 2,3-dioxygenase component B